MTLTRCNYMAFGVAAFVVYNSAVILWELGKPNTQVCKKCAYTRIGVGAAVAVGAVAYSVGALR